MHYPVMQRRKSWLHTLKSFMTEVRIIKKPVWFLSDKDLHHELGILKEIIDRNNLERDIFF